MANPRRTLVPQFSLRWLLAAMAVLAVASFIMSLALCEQVWAAGVLIGLAAMVVVFVVFAGTFSIATFVARLIAVRRAGISGGADDSAKRTPPPLRAGPTISLILIIAACCSMQPTSAVMAASGGTITLPIANPTPAGGPMSKLPPPPSSGLTLTIDTTWVDSFGYRPIRIKFTSTTGPLTADRVLTVRCRAKTGYTNHDGAVATQSIEMPAGTTTATATISMPQLAPSVMQEFDTFEDGQHVDELSVRTGWTSWSGTFQGDGSSPATLLLSGGGTIVLPAMLNTNLQPETLNVGGATSQLIGVTNGVPVATPASAVATPSIATFADLPTNWINYSGFDMIIVSLSQLQVLIDQSPQQWQAIRAWARNGGTLVVYGAGTNWQQLPKVESLLKLSAVKSNDDTSAELDPSKRGWTLPRESMKNLSLLDNALDASVVNSDGSTGSLPSQDVNDPAAKTQVEEAGPKAEEPMAANRAPFAMQPFGLGMVVALRANESFSGNGFKWEWLFNSVGSARWRWFQRYGLSVYRPNSDFWNFLIPGVGLAPVTQFQVLITLFVLAIGPINYWLLKRRGKLNLLVLTVPASALLVTAALVAFAFISDGLSVRVRTRSITAIDQQNGEATCWARLSFYAGLAPGNGLAFADDTVVLPLEFSPKPDDIAATRYIDWERAERGNFKSPLKQQLTDGWLNSRTPTQFITSRIRPTKAKLDINSSAGGLPQVTNRLGANIERIILTDEVGNYFSGIGAEDGAAVSLTSIEKDSSAVKEIMAVLNDNQPRRPEAMINRNDRSFFGLNRQGVQYQPYYYPGMNYRVNGNEPEATQQTGVLERSLAAVQDELLAGRVPPKTYIAIVNQSPEVQLGTPSAHEEASLHVVVGKW